MCSYAVWYYREEASKKSLIFQIWLYFHFQPGFFTPFGAQNGGVLTEPAHFYARGICPLLRQTGRTKALESQAVVAGRRGACWHPEKIPSSSRKPMLRQTALSTTHTKLFMLEEKSCLSKK